MYVIFNFYNLVVLKFKREMPRTERTNKIFMLMFFYTCNLTPFRLIENRQNPASIRHSPGKMAAGPGQLNEYLWREPTLS